MRRFLRDNELRLITFPEEFSDFETLLLGDQRGTVGEMLNSGPHGNIRVSSLTSGDQATEDQSSAVVPFPPVKRIALDEDDTSEMKKMYQILFPDCEIVSVQRLCDSFSRVQIRGTIFRCSCSYGVLAKWFNGEHRPGRVRRFLSNDVILKQGLSKRRKITYVLAEVDWFKKHPKRNWYPDPLEVWCTDFEDYSEMSFIPVIRIHSQCLTVEGKVKFGYGKEKVTVSIPLIGQFSP